jgi:hypothetical protein
MLKRRPTVAAELHTRRVIESTLWAAHARCLPLMFKAVSGRHEVYSPAGQKSMLDREEESA